MSCTTSKGITPPSSLVRAHAPDQTPPPELRGCHLYPAVFAGCCQPLLEDGPSRRYLCKSFPGCLGPDPGGSQGAFACFFPHVVGLPQVPPMGRLPASFRSETSERQVFRDRHHSLRSGLLVCSPPRSLLPLRPEGPQGSRDFYARAEHEPSPIRASGMLAVRTRQLTAEDFHLLDLQPCRPLPGLAPAGTTELSRHTWTSSPSKRHRANVSIAIRPSC